jgi:Fe-coproporphyrin III synthase
MGPTGAIHRILQIHPTRRCNLHCLHCYSSSGPHERGGIDAALLCDALDDARAEGYTVASFSGGEPLLYGSLREVLDHARQRGFRTALVSNGMLLDARRLATIQGAVDVLAISLDGVPASHNRMRASNRAFEIMASRLEGVRASGIPFGFVFTLTQHNLHELEWVASFAVEQGARLLQVHPLEEVGRARESLAGARPDAIEATYAYLAVNRIRTAFGARLQVHLDLAHRDFLRAHPERGLVSEPLDETSTRPLGELLSPLVVEADGTVVPLNYGFARAYAFGNLHDAPLRDLTSTWRRNRYAEFRRLCRRVFDDVTNAEDLPFFNWYEAVGRWGHELPGA